MLQGETLQGEMLQGEMSQGEMSFPPFYVLKVHILAFFV